MTTLVGRRAERRTLIAGLRAGRDLLIEGPAGTGKSLLVREVASAVGRRALVVEGSSAITTGAVLGHHEPAEVLRRGFDRATFVDGPLLMAMRQGYLLHIEEANRVPSDTLNLLLGPLSERRIVVPRVGVVTAAPGFGLVATVNDGDPSGTSPLSRALGERLVRLRLGYQRVEEERAILRQHAPGAPGWLLRAAVTIGRATREHPDLIHGASVRGSIDLLLVARRLAELEDVDLREREPLALNVVLRATLVAMSGRITVQESSARSAEDVLRELWEDELVVRHATPTGLTATVPLPSAIVRRAARPGRPPGEATGDSTVEPANGAEPATELGIEAQSGTGAQLARPAATAGGSAAADESRPATRTTLTDLEIEDLADLAADSSRGAARRRQRRRLAGTDPRLVHQLAVQIIMRRARRATRGRRGTGQLRAARYRFQSDDLDLDRSLAEIAANPYPSHEDFWVQERSPGRRGIGLMLDVSGSMRGAPLVRAALAAAAAAAAAKQDDLATVVFWSQAVVLSSVQNPRPVIRIVEDVLAVRSEGLTDIALGLQTGLRQLELSRARDKIGILLTDGVSNHGGDPVSIARGFPRLHVLATATTPARLRACRRLAAAAGGECLTVARIADIPQALTSCLDS